MRDLKFPTMANATVVVRESGRRMSRRESLKIGLSAGIATSMGIVPGIAFAQEKIPIAQSGVTLFYHYMYVAIDQGLFKEEGIDIDLFTAGGGGGQPAVNALAARQAMGSTQDPVLVEAARQKGANVRSVGALVNRMAVYIVGKKDIPVQDVSGWKGRKIAILQRPNTGASVINYLLTQAGWKEEPRNNWVPPDGGAPMTTVETRQGNQFPPLLAGAVDMAAGFEPGASDAIVRGKDLHMVWSFPNHFGDFLFSSLGAHDDDIRERPELIQSFMNGIAHSYKFVRNEHARSLEIGRKWFKDLDPRALESAFDRFLSEGVYPLRTTIDENAWKANFEQFLPFVNYPLKLPVRMEDATNLEFATKADSKFGLV